MLGINYASSDEDEDATAVNTNTNVPSEHAPEGEPLTAPLSKPIPTKQPIITPSPTDGPSQGPAASLPPEDEDAHIAMEDSPFTSDRALIQNLTLPTVPNFDIPPSPPGSPPRKATQKFAQFLELKKKGQHFNQRLEGSSVLRDPTHLQRLFAFANVSEEEQYASTLSEEVSVPTTFPQWAYAEELKASQKNILKEKEQRKSKAPREAIDFVSASISATSSRTGTPSSSLNAPKRDLEHRSRESSESRSKRRSRSRSPKRRK